MNQLLEQDHPVMPDQVRTRFLLLSDTHARAPGPPGASTLPCRWPLPSADVAIHTGDLTMNGKIEEHEQAVDVLRRLRADLKIVIPGNHDLTLDRAYYAEHSELHGPRPPYTPEQLQYIRELYTGRESRDANIVYLEEGTRSFQLQNGASLTVYASAYTPEFCRWAFAYPRDQDRFNPPHADAAEPVGPGVDVMLTHGPPFGILDGVQDRKTGRWDVHVGCEHLLRAVSRARPLLHCFGHIHEGWGAVRKTWTTERPPGSNAQSAGGDDDDAGAVDTTIDVDHEAMLRDMGVHVDLTDVRRGRETLFVNSSIMNVNYTPNQGAWTVDLMLDKSK